jgi:hypothetical protein
MMGKQHWLVCVAVAASGCTVTTSLDQPLVAPLANAAAAEQQPLVCGKIESPEVPIVSLFAVLVKPALFHGQEIITAGFVGVENGKAVMSVNAESLRHALTMNSVYVDYELCVNRGEFEREAGGRLCVVRGVVDAKDRGPLAFACTIRISRLIRISRVDDD